MDNTEINNNEMIDKKDYIELVQTVIDKYNKLKQSRAQKYALIQYDDYDIEDDIHFTDSGYLEFEMRDDDIAIKILSNCITDIKKLTEKFGIEIASKQIKDTFNYKWYNKVYTDIPCEYRMYYIISE